MSRTVRKTEQDKIVQAVSNLTEAVESLQEFIQENLTEEAISERVKKLIEERDFSDIFGSDDD